jgi:hypothetical protein
MFRMHIDRLCEVKDTTEMIPLLAWLWWLLQAYDAECTLEEVKQSLLPCLRRRFVEETGHQPHSFLEETIQKQQQGPSPYKPKSSRICSAWFLSHVEDDRSAKLEARLWWERRMRAEYHWAVNVLCISFL